VLDNWRAYGMRGTGSNDVRSRTSSSPRRVTPAGRRRRGALRRRRAPR
jgi:hypothetical protein